MDSQVQEIKDKLNITEVVGGYVQLQRAGHSYRARCPFHNERTPSFMVSPERGTYICFGCGEKGDIFSFVQKIEGIDFRAALVMLAARAGIVLRQGSVPSPEHKEHDERLREICEASTSFFEVQLLKRQDVLDYLTTRGVKDETRVSWRLGYAPASWRELSEHLALKGFSKDDIAEAGLAAKSTNKPGEIYDRFRGRIMFPISDAQGRIIAFSGRFFEKVEGSKEEGDPAKYVNSPETPLFKKSRVLFGYDKAKGAIRKLDCILMVEGQFDLILAHQSGLAFAVALSGTALTEEHLSMLGRLSKRLVLALDADSAGIRAGLKSSIMALAAGFDVKVPSFPEGKDPADLARENPELLKSAVRTSKTAIEFFLSALRPNAKDERAYKKLVEVQVLPLVAVLQSNIDQAHFIRLIADHLHVPEDAVRTEVRKKPTLQVDVAPSMELQEKSLELPPNPFERKIGMLLFHFPHGSDVRQKLQALIGEEKLKDLEGEFAPHAETLRFMFDRELGDHTDENIIGEDMLNDIERVVSKERFKMKFL